MKKKLIKFIQTIDRLNDILNENKKLMGQINAIRKERVNFLQTEKLLL